MDADCQRSKGAHQINFHGVSDPGAGPPIYDLVIERAGAKPPSGNHCKKTEKGPGNAIPGPRILYDNDRRRRLLPADRGKRSPTTGG
jgi:hypothetical protein